MGEVRAVGVPPISPVSLLVECIHVLRESAVSLVAHTVSTLHHEPLHSISIHYIVILFNLTTLSRSDFMLLKFWIGSLM